MQPLIAKEGPQPPVNSHTISLAHNNKKVVIVLLNRSCAETRSTQALGRLREKAGSQYRVAIRAVAEQQSSHFSLFVAEYFNRKNCRAWFSPGLR